MDLRIAGDFDSLAAHARTVESFLDSMDIGARQRYVTALAFEEMATNIIKYGFEGLKEEPSLNVSISRSDDALLMVMKDNGKAFNPLDLREPKVDAAIEDRSIGGLGVHLVRQMADGMDYKRENGFNVLTITVKLNGPDGSEGLQ